MDQGIFRRRVYISAVLFALASLFLIGKLASLHFSGKILIDSNPRPEIRRGAIKDRNGYILAMTIESRSLFANPMEIDNAADVASLIGPIIGLPSREIEERLGKKRHFVWLRRKLDDRTAEQVRSLGLKGLYFKNEHLRVYPNRNLASNIIGFAGIDNNGLEGIEFGHDDLLMAKGVDAGSDADYALIRGKNVWLTIDRFVQGVAEAEIEASVRRHSARQGAALVMEVATGRVLALAHYPNFDPNRYYEYPAFARRNFSVIDSFEPGSTMKIISLAALVEYGRLVPGRYYTCAGSVDIGDATINCTGIHGTLDMEGIISNSCNVGIIKAVKDLKREELYSMLRRFGFGQKSCGDLPGETEGILRPTVKWSGLSKYSICIGQEISVTSLQLGAAFSAIANGGVLNAPALIEAVEDPSGEIIQGFYPRARGRAVSKATSDYLLRMMRSVVRHGTGGMAASVYYDSAGKTGTSQKFIRQAGAYSDRVISSFIGIAPYGRPEICVLVFIDDPVDRLSGGTIAAPAFSRIIDTVLPVLGVKNGSMNAKVPIHKPGERRPSIGSVMPDFRGMDLVEAVEALSTLQKERGVEYRISGEGKVYDQQPASGVRFTGKETIILYMKQTQ
ncbi:MAG TPA: penicillin-binding transpeptidase domain-containing protein [Spirochaetota bacterium]|nr:penicillin-binding transpeptidase domain-containing protein [Spirochaetota bacterium]HRZ28356.1 penicillin-binding transpeptidase domain-containing protein [Spirochaetota bacterium]HSA14723.1 penicillin-binding transpeptidase domain-containing protein [Spirochaetota bacterium]